MTKQDERAELLCERDEARSWAAGWHRVVETMLTIAGLSPALGAEEAAAAFQDKLAQQERNLRHWRDECGKLSARNAALEAALHGAEERGRLKGLEEAAGIAAARQAGRERLYEENGASINAYKAVEAEEIAAGIRSLAQQERPAKGER